jgi:class 3 adenylate cyclase
MTMAKAQVSSDSLKVVSYLEKASAARDSGEYALAFEMFTDALAVAREIGDQKGTLKALIGTGQLRLYVDDPIIALESLFRAEKVARDLGNREALAEVYNNIGAIYHMEREFTKAIDYYKRSIDIYVELDKQTEIARAYNNFGALWQDRNEPIIAIDYHRKSLRIWRELNDKGWLRLSNIHLGVCHKLMGNLDSAMHYLTLDTEDSKVTGKDRIQSSVYAEIGNVHIAAGRYQLASIQCQAGLRIASKTGRVNNLLQNCQCLYRAYEELGKDKEALKYYKLYTSYQDSAKNEDKAKEMTRVEMSHQFERKQIADSVQRSQKKILRELEYQRELAHERADRNIALGLGLGILLLAGGLWSRLRYVRRVQRTIKKERDRSEELLLNILPVEIAMELKQFGKAKAKRYDKAAILFTDFERFTDTAAQMHASELVEEINSCFTEFDRICDQYGIEKIKTIGDSYMAAGGLPVPNPNSTVALVQAALDMQQFIRQRVKQRMADGLPSFKMRAGIHVGPVVAGIVGVKKFQYDIWGDTVNTASRLESSGQVGRVNISAATYELVKEEFTCEYRGEIVVKGKGKLGMYFVKERI